MWESILASQSDAWAGCRPLVRPGPSTAGRDPGPILFDVSTTVALGLVLVYLDLIDGPNGMIKDKPYCESNGRVLLRRQQLFEQFVEALAPTFQRHPLWLRDEMRKVQVSGVAAMGPHTRAYTEFVRSAPFRRALEALTAFRRARS